MRSPLLRRLRWYAADLWDRPDAKVVIGLLAAAVLATGGYLASRAAAKASSPSDFVAITVRQKVRVKVHGHLVTRWRTRKVLARAQTVMRTETINTPSGSKVVTRPAVRYVYRKQVVTRNGKTVTQQKAVTQTRQMTATQTRSVTVNQPVTNVQVVTVTRAATTVVTTTVVSTETATVTLPVTITIPGITTIG